MMKVNVQKARVFVTSKFKSEGSVLRETVKAVGLGFETRLELESDDAPENIAAVVRNAENGCYVLQTILNPVPVLRRFTLNRFRSGETFQKGIIITREALCVEDARAEEKS